MSTDELIINVENDISWRESFEGTLRAIGEHREILQVDIKQFLDRFKTSKDFNHISYCFVDLELGAGTSKELNDTWGLDRVLPHIRKLAPWIPVACLSRYIISYPEIIGRLAVSDFDGIYPKEIISKKVDREEDKWKTHPNFNLSVWNEMLKGLRIRRLASMTGRSVLQIRELLDNAARTKLTMSDSVKEEVEKLGESAFKEGIVLMGLGGTDISIDEIIMGFSGVFVAKGGAFGDDGQGPVHSYWLLKWGKQICKIAEESDAHKRIFQRGLDRSLQVAQLHPNVICWDNIGYIAYGFEKDANTALETIKNSGILGFIPSMEKIAHGLYSTKKIAPLHPRDEVKRWCQLDELKYSKFNATLSHPVEATTTLIHGDLHLRNILIKNGRTTLIDFAKSNLGPIVIDFAKLTIDILAFCMKEEIKPDFFDWDGLKKSSLKDLLQMFEIYMTAKDDKRFFDIALYAYASTYLTYPDVEHDVKEAIESVLAKLP